MTNEPSQQMSPSDRFRQGLLAALEDYENSREQEIAATGWQPGDLVLAADGHLWSRAYPEDVAKGWPWAHSTEQVGAGSGAVEEGYPARPLTLLVRDGNAVGGVKVSE